ncbi:vacuolar transporter chaperone [Marasmius tenuissimus]|nr:vacuolar transporter chaperone [Marasmius tenuissimus]
MAPPEVLIREDDANQRFHDFSEARPKLAFANERTFLAYMHVLVLLGGISLGLLNFQQKEGLISSTIFAILVILGILYSLNSYHSRAASIRMGREDVFTDRKGPTLLLVAFSVVAITNFTIRFSEL